MIKKGPFLVQSRWPTERAWHTGNGPPRAIAAWAFQSAAPRPGWPGAPPTRLVGAAVTAAAAVCCSITLYILIYIYIYTYIYIFIIWGEILYFSFFEKDTKKILFICSQIQEITLHRIRTLGINNHATKHTQDTQKLIQESEFVQKPTFLKIRQSFESACFFYLYKPPLAGLNF